MDINNFSNDKKKRAALTVSCDDCNYILKCSKAGQSEYDDTIDKQIQYMFNGLKIIRGCYEGDWMTYIIDRLKGHHEPQEEKVFYEVLQRIPKSENNIMIELGANWSYYSMWFTKQVGGKAVIVEPNMKKLKIGVANFNLNNLNCIALNGFIGRSYKEKDRFVDWDSAKFITPRYSVDYLIKRFDIKENLTLLHSDIQGAEYDMLLGARQSLKAAKIDYIFISTHKNNKHKSCLDILTRNKYHIIASHKIRESVSADGLIAASSSRIEKFNVEITKVKL
ncbi:MAG: FkbM family methyltransferase [Candidatus Omnitrophica bacterium]|nr:FkbM family methyltransferase [Candidatus Omnitrophota bacterium]